MPKSAVIHTGPPWLLLLSASDRAALGERARLVAATLADGVDPARVVPAEYGPVGGGAERLAVAAADHAGLLEGLSLFAEGAPSPRWTAGRVAEPGGQVAWCFGGHGGQWAGMGRDLLDGAPPAARVLIDLDALLPSGVLGPLRETGREDFDTLAVVQPLIFAMQVAMARWLETVGLRPSVILGHSLGEVAAAHIAGALTLAEAAHVVAVRSALLARAGGGGAMAVLGLDRYTTARRLKEIPGVLTVAAHAAPRETVITGEAESVRALVGRLEPEGVRCRLVRIAAASHSPLVDGVLPELLTALQDLVPSVPSVPWLSTVDDDPDGAPVVDARYWARNLRRPVRFTQAVTALASRDVRVIVEIGPHPVVLRSVREALRAEGAHNTLLVATGQRGTPERVSLLRLLGALYCRGLDFDLLAVHG